RLRSPAWSESYSVSTPPFARPKWTPSKLCATSKSEHHELALAQFPQAADSESQQSQGPCDQLLTPQQETAEPVNFFGFGQWLLHRNLACQRCEIAVAHLHLDGVGAQTPALEAPGNICRLRSQTRPQHLPLFGVL